MKLLAILTLCLSATAEAANHCNKYANQKEVTTAIQVVAKEMNATFTELCNSQKIGDIYATKHTIYTRVGDPIPHVWVNLHYWTYTCQFFVRQSDNVITKGNCYNGD